MAAGASVHVVFWGTKPLTHDISCVCASDGAGQFATGSRSGQICIWDLERGAEGLKATPLMLFFTTDNKSILSLCHVKPHSSGDHPKLASLAENGSVRLWDAKEKACLRHRALPPCYHSLKVFERWTRSVSLLALNGQCTDILLLNSSTLTTVYVLKSDHAPNWNICVCFLPNVENRDALLSITADGTIKVWCLPNARSPTTQEELIEDSSKSFDLANVHSFTAHAHKGFSRVLAVTPYLWKAMDATAGHLKLLCSMDSEQPKWRGGTFVTLETVLLWTQDGTGILYQLPSPTSDSSIHESVPIISVLVTAPQSDSDMVFNVLSEGHETACIIAGSGSGKVHLWSAEPLRRDGGKTPPLCSAALRDSWTHPLRPCSLSDTVFPHGRSPSMTCAVHLESIGRLVCGHDDGTIVMFYPAQAATILLLSPRRMTAGWPQHCIMRGHEGCVLTFIYPYTYNTRSCDNTLLLSGGEDFTVRLWDLYNGTLLHTYRAHSGPVCVLHPVPADLAPRYQSCICSVGKDYSVAILSIAERNCIFLASCHDAPITSVKWRPLEDFLVVGCADDKVFVWQMETGSLDRCVSGVAGDIILKHSKAPPPASEGTEPTALRVINLHPLPSDPVIQVLQFNPLVIISLLSKAPELLALPQQRERQQIQSGFRQYWQARRHFSADPGGGVSDKRSEVELEMTRDQLAQKVASVRQEQLQGEWPKHIIGIVRLLLSCLHAWGADRDLDRDLEGRVGLIRPIRPISFGLASRGGSLSLVLPGWVSRRTSSTPPSSPQTSKLSLTTPISRVPFVDLASIQDQRWGLSQLLTTQHLLTVVSLANTLMNYIRGAQLLALAASRPTGDSLSEDSEEEEEGTTDEGIRDNMIRASWSQVTALHCVMLPERQGRHFRAPNLTVLAERYPDKCVEVREAAQAILQSELRRVGPDGRGQLVRSWSSKLPSAAPTSLKTPSVDEEGLSFEDFDPSQTNATPVQQYTALVILGVIGAEFCRVTGAKGNRRSADLEAMDAGVARQVAKALQSVILEKPQPSLSLGTSWRRSAVDLMGRGFHLWSSFISASRIIMALLDLCSLCPRGIEGGTTSSNRLMGGVARKALSLMVITNPRLIIETLSTEVLYFLQSSHMMHFPHSTLHPVPVGISTPTPTSGITTPGDGLLPRVKGDVMLLMDTAVDKCSHEVSIHLVEVVDILLFCVSAEHLKKEKNLLELIPALKRLTLNVSYSPRSRKLAVGSKSGRVCIYDFKHFHCDSVNAHSSAVTTLQLSEDGKLLASYAHGDSALKVWQVGSTMMSVIRTMPKCTHSWPVVSVGQRGEALEWLSNRSVILHTMDGLQHKYSL